MNMLGVTMYWDRERIVRNLSLSWILIQAAATGAIWIFQPKWDFTQKMCARACANQNNRTPFKRKGYIHKGHTKRISSWCRDFHGCFLFSLGPRPDLACLYSLYYISWNQGDRECCLLQPTSISISGIPIPAIWLEVRVRASQWLGDIPVRTTYNDDTHNTHTYTHTHIHTYIHIYIHTYIHTHIHIHIHILIYYIFYRSHTHICIYIYINKYR